MCGEISVYVAKFKMIFIVFIDIFYIFISIKRKSNTILVR